LPRSVAALALGISVFGPTSGAQAQLARARVTPPDAPKLLVLPFVRDSRDSALSLLVADGARERLRTAHLDKFNTITRENLCRVLTESGFPGIGSMNWNGMFVPAGTPKPVIEKLYAATVAVMKEAEMQELFAKRSVPPVLSASPAEFNAYVQSESRRWDKIIRDNNVRID
jgi:hypothetical protein